jgi:excinuclease ABC subunit C
LKGNFKESMKDFKRVMTDLALNMHFEEAQKIKEKIEILENYQSLRLSTRKLPISMSFQSYPDESAAYVNFCKFPRFHHSIPHYGNQKKLDETDEELLELAIIEVANVFNYCPVR